MSRALPWTSSLALAMTVLGSSVHAANTDLQTIRTKVYRAIASDPNVVALTPSAVVPPSSSTASGIVSLTANNPFTHLSYNVTHNVPGETSATIRGPGYAWENAPVMHNLPLGSPKVGSWSVTVSQRDHILAGRTYLEIRSASFPSGAIRGQLVATNPPVGGRGIWVRVLVLNHGPDTYVPGTLKSSWEYHGRGSWPGIAAPGDLKISVDIDEPTKPGLGRPMGIFNVQREFAVTIAPFDTVEVDLGVVGYTPSPGDLTTATTSIAQFPNIDGVPSNNQRTDEFNVFPDPTPVPSTGATMVLVAATSLAVIGGVRAAQRRRRTNVQRDSGGNA